MSTQPVLTTGVVIFSLKTFFASMLAYLVAISFDLPRPFWAVATVYIVADPLSGAISSKSIYRLLGTLIGGCATIIMIPNLVNDPILLSSAIIAWVSGCTFLSIIDRTPRGYVPLLAGYTVLLAGLPLVTAPANTFNTVVSRIEEIGLAIICASVVSHVVFPVHAGPVLVGRIDGWMARAQTLFTQIAFGKVDDTRSLRERQSLAFEAAELRSFTTHLPYDGSRYRKFVPVTRRLQNHMVSLLPLLSELEDLRRSLARLNSEHAVSALSKIEKISSRIEYPLVKLDERALIDPGTVVSSTASQSWEDLVLANVAQNLTDIERAFDDCELLRASLDADKVLGTDRFTFPNRAPATHRDIGMALLSALAVAACLATSILFWIASGWPDGMTFAQISGVLCCLLATMDDPIPAMRKFADVTIGAIVAAFVYAFSIVPMIDGFIPLVAALGLFLIPAGICLAIPSLALIGMGLCINFPLLLTLGTQQSSDFVAFSNITLATVLAMAWCPIVCSLFRTVKAETNARRFLSVVRLHVAKVADGRYSRAHPTHNQMIDVAGLFASRATKLPPTSNIANLDPIRHLRIGLHLMEMQLLIPGVSMPVRQKAELVFVALGNLYRMKPAGRKQDGAEVIGALDDLILPLLGQTIPDVEAKLLLIATALRICVSPGIDPQVSPNPSTRMEAA